MDKEHIEEIQREEAQQLKDEPFMEWVELNHSEIELKFLEQFPPEDQPLDDDIPDFLDNYADEFEKFAKEWYEQQKEE